MDSGHWVLKIALCCSCLCTDVYYWGKLGILCFCCWVSYAAEWAKRAKCRLYIFKRPVPVIYYQASNLSFQCNVLTYIISALTTPAHLFCLLSLSQQHACATLLGYFISTSLSPRLSNYCQPHPPHPGQCVVSLFPPSAKKEELVWLVLTKGYQILLSVLSSSSPRGALRKPAFENFCVPMLCWDSFLFSLASPPLYSSSTCVRHHEIVVSQLTPHTRSHDIIRTFSKPNGTECLFFWMLTCMVTFQ